MSEIGLTETPAVPRRGMLRTLGLGIAALAALPGVAEGKSKGRGKNKKKQKAQDRCAPQVAACNAAFEEFCSNAMGSAECRAAATECCQPLGICDANAALDCFIFRFLAA